MYKKFLKRILDILISIIGLPVFVLLYIIFGLLIKFEDKVPYFIKLIVLGKIASLLKCISFAQ